MEELPSVGEDSETLTAHRQLILPSKSLQGLWERYFLARKLV
jgi:hypothetical protein